MSIAGLGKILDDIERKNGKEFRDAVMRSFAKRQGIPFPLTAQAKASNGLPHCGQAGCDGTCLDVECDGSTPNTLAAESYAATMRRWTRGTVGVLLMAAFVVAAIMLVSEQMQVRSRREAERKLAAEWRCEKPALGIVREP